jgi:hypothetical protein
MSALSCTSIIIIHKTNPGVKNQEEPKGVTTRTWVFLHTNTIHLQIKSYSNIESRVQSKLVHRSKCYLNDSVTKLPSYRSYPIQV